MQMFTQRRFFMFGLRCNTAARRTPAMLQIERSQGDHPQNNSRRPQAPAPFAVGIEVLQDGSRYIRPLAHGKSFV